MVDYWLLAALGFLGSFGHCVGMCGPLAAAFSLANAHAEPDPSADASAADTVGSRSAALLAKLWFHGLLNLGRLVSYSAVGGFIGGLGSTLVAGGQLAGIDSALRQGLSLFTGLLLVWFGLSQVRPHWLPRVPLLHPLLTGAGHDRLGAALGRTARSDRPWMPLMLGLVWGLMPCGFLYAAQIKAASSGSALAGAATVLMFGLGTVPAMVGVGVSASWLSRDRRSQLFRLGGWVTLAIGLITLARTDAMVDLTGHGALLLLGLALVARPLAGLWPAPLRYRRALGVGAYGLTWAHVGHTLEHTFQWQPQTVVFMLPLHQLGIWAGLIALLGLTPAALTSFDRAMRWLGPWWRSLHLLSVGAWVLAAIHALCVGSSYGGSLATDPVGTGVRCGLLLAVAIAVLLMRDRRVWQGIALGKWYGPANGAAALQPPASVVPTSQSPAQSGSATHLPQANNPKKS
jgi:sulfite exporter TauE/SafE